MIKEQQSQKIPELQEREKYVIPSWKIVTYKILETYYSLLDDYALLINDSDNPSTQKRCTAKIITLIFMLRNYNNISKNVKLWPQLRNIIDRLKKEKNFEISFDVADYAINIITDAIHHCGLTDIEKEKLDPGEAIQRL